MQLGIDWSRGHLAKALIQPRRSFYATPILRMSIPSAERNVKVDLEDCRHSKFGYIVYRTAYTRESDDLWPRFKQILQERARLHISKSDTPELNDHLDFRFIEDRSALEDATVAQLRAIFNTWRQLPEAQAEQPHATFPVHLSGLPRYRYCIRADAEVLRSVCHAPQPPEEDFEGTGFVHFINAEWEPDSDDAITDDEKYPPIEGCEEEDVGWVKLASWLTGADGYEMSSADDIWHVLYRRPPQITKDPSY